MKKIKGLIVLVCLFCFINAEEKSELIECKFLTVLENNMIKVSYEGDYKYVQLKYLKTSGSYKDSIADINKFIGASVKIDKKILNQKGIPRGIVRFEKTNFIGPNEISYLLHLTQGAKLTADGVKLYLKSKRYQFSRLKAYGKVSLKSLEDVEVYIISCGSSFDWNIYKKNVTLVSIIDKNLFKVKVEGEIVYIKAPNIAKILNQKAIEDLFKAGDVSVLKIHKNQEFSLEDLYYKDKNFALYIKAKKYFELDEEKVFKRKDRAIYFPDTDDDS